MNVSLSAEAAEVVTEKLRNGEFQSAEEVVAEALRAFRRPGSPKAISDSPSDSVKAATEFFAGLKGVRPPAQWPANFPDFEPIPVEGELPSRQLIDERR